MTKPNTDILIDTGMWGDASWELYQSPQVPDVDPRLIMSAGCVAIKRLYSGEVVLTLNPARQLPDGTVKGPKFEIQCGHIDLLDPNQPLGPRETPEQTARREALEEGGAILSKLNPFAYYKTNNPPGSKYPETSYGIIYRGLLVGELVDPTDPNKPVRGLFLPGDLDGLVRDGLMDSVERTIVALGVAEERRR